MRERAEEDEEEEAGEGGGQVTVDGIEGRDDAGVVMIVMVGIMEWK